jgi:hypothetical protein
LSSTIMSKSESEAVTDFLSKSNKARQSLCGEGFRVTFGVLLSICFSLTMSQHAQPLGSRIFSLGKSGLATRNQRA